MNCSQFEQLWNTRSMDGLPPAARHHLCSCPTCAALVQADSSNYSSPPLSSAQPTPDACSAPNLKLSRRELIKTGLAGLFASLTTKVNFAFGSEKPDVPVVALDPDAPVEYIVIGSGAGGGPLACNLAKAGHKVVLFEAGGDDADDISSVPFFALATTEDERIRWDYYVRHYASDEQQQRDSKYLSEKGGVWYPRVGSLGGCSVHSALIEIYPSDSDWDNIAELTGDPSWNAVNMRAYFERLEQCRYAGRQTSGNPARHGFNGWQPTEIPDLAPFLRDFKVVQLLRTAAQEIGGNWWHRLLNFVGRRLDPNDWRLQHNREGFYNVSLFTKNGRRVGPRQLIRETAAALPNNLIVKTHTLVTRVLFEDTTATGVEYLEGEHLYRADPNASTADPGSSKTLSASREVIVAAGAFNSPQLLKLSGIGPEEELRGYGITPIVNLPGVGENLQDRYEIGVVTEMKTDFTGTDACRTGQPDDPCFAAWLRGKGPYTTNGIIDALMLKSNTARAAGRPDPDLCILDGLTQFKGYYPGYSVDITAPEIRHKSTWAILKAHTLNRAGTVKLRSSDPRDTPIINFHYFDEGSDTQLEDLWSVVDGIEIVRRMNSRIADISDGDVLPGPQVQSREDIAQFVRNEAWGHHASCTCKIGPANDPMAVVDGDFRVHGTRNLRIVDASVFPVIPGYFILIPIYMISEKASDVILASAKEMPSNSPELSRTISPASTIILAGANET